MWWSIIAMWGISSCKLSGHGSKLGTPIIGWSILWSPKVFNFEPCPKWMVYKGKYHEHELCRGTPIRLRLVVYVKLEYIYILYIWAKYNISLTWNKAILGMIPLTNYDYSEVAVRSQWGRYNLPRQIMMFEANNQMRVDKRGLVNVLIFHITQILGV